MRLTVTMARSLFPALKLPEQPKQKRPPSEGEELFVKMCRIRQLPMFKREHRFALSIERQWRFDFAWPEFKVATEIEGLVCKYIEGIPYAIGRHCTFAGFESDCEKYAKANEFGWHVNRFNQRLVKNYTAVDMTRDLLIARGWKP